MNRITWILVAVAISSVNGQFGRRKEASCPKPTLDNGRIRLRAAGRIVKFACSKGYFLLGDSTATCIDGQWTNSAPVCARGGCPKLDPPVNGRLVGLLFQSVMYTECDPGYVLGGPRILYCDGDRWNGSVAMCSGAGKKPELSCDFETEGLCGWNQDRSHNFDWRRINTAAPSAYVGTGPSFDHTLGEGRNGNYIYTEASAPRLENDTARLFSPIYGPDLISDGCFLFWYHMYGTTMGRLRVYVKPESKKLSQVTPAFIRSGNQGNRWIQGYIQLPNDINENFQVVIEGVRGSGYLSDIGIDDVLLGQGEQCKTAANGTAANPDGNEKTQDPGKEPNAARGESCSTRCGSLGANDTCDCRSSCLLEGTCCADYTIFCSDDVNINSDQPWMARQGKSETTWGFDDTLTLGLVVGAAIVTLTVTLTAIAIFRRRGQRSRLSKAQNRLPEDSDVRFLREDDDVQLDLTEATPSSFANFEQI